jgi:RNA polymerase sigma factor
LADTINIISVKDCFDGRTREDFIQSNESMILRTASKACGRFITKSDDEWSVAVYAFSRAMDIYDADKGIFIPFAQMLIKRDLIDYHRAQQKTLAEISVAPYILEGNGEPEEDCNGVYEAVVRSSREASDTGIKEEIEEVNSLLRRFGFRFFELTECSPRQDKTKRACAVAIRYILEQPIIMDEMERTRRLPIKAVAAGSGVSKKLLDRYRKYIIMAVLVLSGDYPRIGEYLKFVKEELV